MCWSSIGRRHEGVQQQRRDQRRQGGAEREEPPAVRSAAGPRHVKFGHGE